MNRLLAILLLATCSLCEDDDSESAYNICIGGCDPACEGAKVCTGFDCRCVCGEMAQCIIDGPNAACEPGQICRDCECVGVNTCDDLYLIADGVSCRNDADCRNGAACSVFPTCQCVSAYCEMQADADCAKDEDCGPGGFCNPSCRCGGWTEDGISDFIDSISGREATLRSDSVDITKWGAFSHPMSLEDVNELFGNTVFECGVADPNIVAVCPSNVQPFPEGDVIVATMTMLDVAPTGNAEHSFVYALVLDSDGDPANDWQYVEPFDFDLFQGADRWYELVWDHLSQAWTVRVTQVDASQNTAPSPSAVRVGIEGIKISFYIPATELGTSSPAYRMTAFAHDGNFSEAERGADVIGGDPTEPLSPIGPP